MTVATTPRKRAFAAWWRDFERWDVKFFSARVRSSFPVVRLGPLIHEHSERVKPFDNPETIFRILGVTNTGGIFHAYDALGKEINQPYQRVDAGDFAYNPYRVNIGSIGVVSTALGGNYISPAYVVFATDKARLLPEYLILILKADWFNPMVRAATAGSVRQNLTFDLLCTLEIPLPPLAEQKAIVARWRKAQDEIAAARDRVEKRKATIDARFFADLGLKSPDQHSMPKAFAVWWQDFLRWGVGFNYLNQSGADLARGKYPVVELGTLLKLVQYGTSEKANTNSDGVAVIRMNNIVDGQLDLGNLKHLRLPKSDLEKLLLKDGDILFNRTNSKELVGKCAVFHGHGEYVFASYLIRIRADSAKADAQFVAYVVNCSIGRQQIDALSRQIIGQANINSVEMRGLQIPLPPLAVQKQIMERVAAGREEIARERETADRLARDINAEVEALILGTKKVSEL
ncbi:MAG: restriction endonuclease subunit S [Planctomycetota bacterium]